MEVNQAPDNFPAAPVDRVVGVIDTWDQAQAAVDSLADLGFDTDSEDVLVYCGEQAIRQIDISGEHHGWWGKIVRSLQDLANELDYGKEIEQELKAHHFVVTVLAPSSEGKKQVRDILEAHGGHHITAFGPLGPGTGW